MNKKYSIISINNSIPWELIDWTDCECRLDVIIVIYWVENCFILSIKHLNTIALAKILIQNSIFCATVTDIEKIDNYNINYICQGFMLIV